MQLNGHKTKLNENIFHISICRLNRERSRLEASLTRVLFVENATCRLTVFAFPAWKFESSLMLFNSFCDKLKSKRDFDFL